MPSHVYSKRLAAASGTNAWQYFAVPAGKVWVVKQVDAYNSASSGQNAYVSIALQVIAGATPLASAAALHYSGMQVLRAGEQLGLFGQSASITMAVSGYEFDAT